MIRRPPRSTLTDTLLPYTTLFRSCAVLNADDPNVLRMSGYTRQDHLLRDDESVALAGARAYPCRRARLRAGGRRQRPHDHALRQGQPHPADVDPPDPGAARGSRAAKRAERDVRRGDAVFDGDKPPRDPPGPAHLRPHLLPGTGADERVQGAPVTDAERTR